VDRPRCPDHPGSPVWRDGRYGKNRQRQRWRCVPRNGERPHRFTPVLPMRQMGGADGSCLECSRGWEPWEGMPAGGDDRYTIREKSRTLVSLAHGESYRSAARHIRDLAGFTTVGPNGELQVSRDGRLTMDWVPHYASILREEYLPDYWPEVLVLDHLPFHVKAQTAAGLPKPSGRVAFHVLAALSYGDGSEQAASKRGDREPRLWRVAADTKVGEQNWRRFLESLEGQPEYVVCDRQQGLLKAVRKTWPEARVYLCAHHLRRNVEEYVRKADLRLTPLATTVHARTFVDMEAFEAFSDALGEATASDHWARVSVEQKRWLRRLQAWLEDGHEAIMRTITEQHAPLTTGGLEKPLREIKNALYDRRALFKNLDRLESLLVLMQLRQNGLANGQRWGDLLYKAHLRGDGRVAGRRRVDTTVRRIR
jgi:hypothetical protein